MKKGIKWVCWLGFAAMITVMPNLVHESYGLDKPIKLTFGAPGMGSAPYIFSAAVAEAIKKALPAGSSVMISSGGSFENLARLESGDIEAAHVTSIILSAGLHGRKPFNSAVKNIRILSGITPPTLNEFHFIVGKDVPVNSFNEIRDKKYPLKLVTRTVGVAGEIMTDSVFRAYGFNYDDIKKWGGTVTMAALSTGFELMKDGRVEAFGCSHTYPTALINDLIKDRGGRLKWFSIDDQSIFAKLEELGMPKVILPKGHYTGLESEVSTICGPEIIAMNANVSNDVAYAMIKAICENSESIRASHGAVSTFTPEMAYKWALSFTKYVPLHPGVEKYFREKGYMK